MAANSYEVSFQGDKNVRKLVVVMVTKLHEYTKNY